MKAIIKQIVRLSPFQNDLITFEPGSHYCISPTDFMNGQPDSVQLGDNVTWMHCISNGSSMRFMTRRGKVIKLRGKTAYVRMRNGRRVDVHVSELRKRGDKTELTDLTEMLFT